MILEFSTDEVIEILSKLGYEVKKLEQDDVKSYRKIFDKSEKYYVLIDGQQVSANDIFKQEFIKKFLNA